MFAVVQQIANHSGKAQPVPYDGWILDTKKDDAKWKQVKQMLRENSEKYAEFAEYASYLRYLSPEWFTDIENMKQLRNELENAQRGDVSTRLRDYFVQDGQELWKKGVYSNRKQEYINWDEYKPIIGEWIYADYADNKSCVINSAMEWLFPHNVVTIDNIKNWDDFGKYIAVPYEQFNNFILIHSTNRANPDREIEAKYLYYTYWHTYLGDIECHAFMQVCSKNKQTNVFTVHPLSTPRRIFIICATREQADPAPTRITNHTKLL